MIEVTIKKKLDELMDVPVHMIRPDPAPKRFIVFEKTGSMKRNHLGGSTFAFQSYAESLYEAAKLNDLLKEKVEDLIVLNEIVSVKLNSDYNFTDQETKRYRYQAVYDITHY